MGGTAPAGTNPPEPSGARPKRPRGFSCGPERETSDSEAGVAARLMRRDGRSSSAGFLRVLGCPLVTPTETNQSSAFNRRAGRRRGRPGEQSSSSTERGAVPILSRPAIQPRSELPPPARNCWGSSFVAGSVFDERGKSLGFSVAGGSSADTVAPRQVKGPGLVLLTVPFIGRERGENSGAVWRPHSGHKLKLKKTPPAPGLPPRWG
jgi:hypothetical protein